MHTQTFTRVAALVLVTVGRPATQRAGQGPPVPRIAEAAARGVAAIQKSQAVWYEEQSCSSCHHQFQPAIAFAVARAHGVAVNESVATTNRTVVRVPGRRRRPSVRQRHRTSAAGRLPAARSACGRNRADGRHRPDGALSHRATTACGWRNRFESTPALVVERLREDSYRRACRAAVSSSRRCRNEPVILLPAPRHG